MGTGDHHLIRAAASIFKEQTEGEVPFASGFSTIAVKSPVRGEDRANVSICKRGFGGPHRAL